jgi:DHA3 family tetracycline resistance protein-like MFS transporter
LAQLAALTGIAVNVALASVQLYLPFLFAGIGHIGLALFLVLFMPEKGFTPTPQADRHTWRKMNRTFREGMSTIRQRPLLVTILGIALVYGLYSEALDRLWEAHILDNFTLPQIGNMPTVVWFGIINAAIMIIVIGTTELVRRRSGKLDHHKTVRLLALFSAVMSAGLLLFGLASSFVMAVLSYSAVSIVRRTMAPLYRAWINRGIPSQVRATVLSTYGQMDAIGQMLGGPAIGVIANLFGLRAAIVLAGVLLTPVLALYRRAYNQGSESHSVESLESAA